MIRMIENHRFLMFFLTLEEQNRITAQAKRTFSLLSHTPANRNECPCCKHFLTTPANTSIFCLTFKNQNFKFVTLSRAPSQPVALFYHVFVEKKNREMTGPPNYITFIFLRWVAQPATSSDLCFVVSQPDTCPLNGYLWSPSQCICIG